jgi:uncharacterized protein (DUF2141 family)
VPGATGNTLRFELLLDGEGGGDVLCGLFTRSGWPWKPVDYDRVPASGGAVTCEFAGLAPGQYAMAAFHDRNGNGDLDRSWLGFPKEHWALSQGVRPDLPIPPQFDEVAFDYRGGLQTLHAQLK